MPKKQHGACLRWDVQIWQKWKKASGMYMKSQYMMKATALQTYAAQYVTTCNSMYTRKKCYHITNFFKRSEKNIVSSFLQDSIWQKLLCTLHTSFTTMFKIYIYASYITRMDRETYKILDWWEFIIDTNQTVVIDDKVCLNFIVWKLKKLYKKTEPTIT